MYVQFSYRAEIINNIIVIIISGRSPSSSESTTPEALTPSANPPSLQPIKENYCQLPNPVRSPSPVESTAL